MKIELTPDAAQWVQAEVAAGRFETPEDAVRHAIRQTKLRDLRAVIDASIAGGGSYSLEEVIARANAHLEQLNQTPADS